MEQIMLLVEDQEWAIIDEGQAAQYLLPIHCHINRFILRNKPQIIGQTI